MRNHAARAGWLTQAPARAEPSSGFAASSQPPPRSATLRQPATHGRVTGSLPPALAGQISALIPSPRHAPLSHNGAWWTAVILFRGIPPRYPPRPLCEAVFAPLRSAGVLLPRWSCIVHGVGRSLTRAGKIPPHRPSRPWPRRRGHRQGSPPALWPHAEEAGPRGRARQNTAAKIKIKLL